MEFDEIKQILDLVREHELAEFELEREGMKIRVTKAFAVQHATPPGPVAQRAPSSPPPAPAPVHAPASDSAPAIVGPAAPVAVPERDAVELAVVKSPIVGTFYRSSEPAAPPYVDVGDAVKKGQVLCIIEAMKLMNEIECEYEGEVVQVYVDSGQPVQYGERLFAIRTA